MAAYVFSTASRMFAVTGPVISRPSAWRGDATYWIPNRPRSNTTVPSTLTSASQPLQPPALTTRSLSERPNNRRSSSPSGVELTPVDVGGMTQFVYGELGAYGNRLGTPCDGKFPR